ncbi:carotenoid oxygenase family protein, partial [Mycobacterium kansasii]
FGGTLRGGYTAHPHRDPRTGELHAVSYSFARGGTVQYSVIDTRGRARRTVDIEVTGSPMMHDFSLTDNYVVVYDLPVTFDSS